MAIDDGVLEALSFEVNRGSSQCQRYRTRGLPETLLPY
jgi:hypothetical protein